MELHGYLLFSLLSLSTLVVNGLVSHNADRKIDLSYGIGGLNRSSFPASFIFGTASAAYQYEGAAFEDGRGPSIWDYFTHKYPGKIMDHSNGDVAIDSYHKYKEDVKIMKEMGLDAYRFSISWSRVLPHGKISRGVNKEGIMYYHNLINELIANGIQPFVMLFHWDLPQSLQNAYGGFLSPRIVDDFRDYADLCFREYGDRVKHWITLNEPYSYVHSGYVTGEYAPGRCSRWQNLNCTGGDSGTEPYLVTHYQLLAHAAAVEVYRQRYQASQKGIIGITLYSNWFVAFTEEKRDLDASYRALDFMFGWFMDPVTYSDYPHTMQSLLGDRLPKFTNAESKLLKRSYDFLGLNYYTSNYAADAPNLKNAIPNYETDSLVNRTMERHGTLIGPKATSNWLYVYPSGFRELLLYTKRKYNNPIIYITENGFDEVNNDKLSLNKALIDTKRIDYHHSHLAFLQLAIRDGVDVRGYFAWSLLDNFEWASGYTVRFGLNYVDYKDGLKRHPKLSANWFKKFLQRRD